MPLDAEDRPVHRGAVLVELARPAAVGRGALGDRRVAADVGHQHGDLELLGLADLAALLAELLGEAAGQQAGERLALLLAVDDRLVEHPQPAQRAVVAGRRALGQHEEEVLDLVAHRLGRGVPGHRDRLDGPALGDEGEQLLVGGVRSSSPGCTGRTRASTITGSRSVPPVATARMASAELVALGQAVLQQVGVAGRAVGEQRDGVLGVVVLAEDHDAGAGLALADLLGRVDALALEGRRHADVADDDLGLVLGGRRQQLGVVGRLADDLDVGLAGQQRPHARAHEEVVVGQDHRDHAVGHARPSSHI